MARASYQLSQPNDPERSEGDWRDLRHELVALLDQVDSQVARSRAPAASERPRYDTDSNDLRHRDALRSVQRAITRFEEPPPERPMSPNPRDSLQAAINQIRSRQAEPAPRPAAPPPPRFADPQMLDKLAQSVGGLSSRLERIEGDIRAQLKNGANVKDVADQVSQLAHVVELLAGAVGETGQVKRLEGQIASLGKILSQGREMDIQTLTRRLDDVAATVGKLAELQVHYADKVQNPVESQAFQDGMRSIEDSVRNVYDRMDALERQRSLSPQDLDHVTAEMSRFTDALRDGQQAPAHLVELVDALNTRISDIESGDRLLHGLRKDLGALRDAVIVSLTPRFDAIEHRMERLSTRDDMAEIARQIGVLGDRMGDRSVDPGIGQLEAQVRQLVARMDQTGEQLSGLARLYSGEPNQIAMPDFDAVADLVATPTAEAVQRQVPVVDSSLGDTIAALEGRISAMLQTMRRDPEVDAFDGMQATIGEVNDRLKRLETSLLERASKPVEPSRPSTAIETPRSDYTAFSTADAEMTVPASRPRADAMPRNPDDDMPLVAPAFPDPIGPVADALEAKISPRKRHPGLAEEMSLAARYDAKPPAPVPSFTAETVPLPPAPKPSLEFTDVTPPASAGTSGVAQDASTNTFIAAARRVAQRQTQAEPASNSLISKALSRFHISGGADAGAKPPVKTKAPPSRPSVADKPARKMFKPEPVAPPPAPAAVVAPSIEPQIGDASAHHGSSEAKESFLLRNRKVILLGAAVVALAFLTLNLVVQRLAPPEQSPAADAQPAAPAGSAPATTGDIGSVVPMLDEGDALAASMPPRVIPMVNSLSTGSINSAAVQGFTTSPAQAMPSAFQAATQMANADPASSLVAPLVPQASPVKVDMPPDAIGPLDLRQAAADGDARAQFEVAAIYTEGRAVPQDYKAAAMWYERAAAQGFAPAQYRLGSLYESGNGVAKDLDAARLWYERAAEAGNRMSMHNLAALYASGQLGKQAFESAAKWFEEAASRGLTDSQFNLGMLYARGLGVPQNLETSFKWFGIAARSGDKDAAKARDDIARSLDASKTAGLTEEVNTFKPASIDLAANFAPIGTWTKSFDPGETITAHDIVASVQKALGKLGYDIGTPDGVAGKKTQDAIKSFEGATGMSEIGQINPRLLAVLGSQPV